MLFPLYSRYILYFLKSKHIYLSSIDEMIYNKYPHYILKLTKYLSFVFFPCCLCLGLKCSIFILFQKLFLFLQTSFYKFKCSIRRNNNQPQPIVYIIYPLLLLILLLYYYSIKMLRETDKSVKMNDNNYNNYIVYTSPHKVRA